VDSITQGILGAVTAELGFRQRIGADAAWVAAGAAILPDLDLLFSLFPSFGGVEVGVLTHVTIHRSWSHSLFVAPLLSLPIALAWWWIRRQKRDMGTAQGKNPPSLLLLYSCVLVAVLTQPLLDWCTSYGTQLLLPISNKRYALDAVSIVDIIYTPLLVLTLITCHGVRNRSGKQAGRNAVIIGWIGFLLTTAYLVAGWSLHHSAIKKVRHRLQPDALSRVEAYPMVGTILLWRVVIHTPSRWLVVRVHHLADPAEPFRTAEVSTQTNSWIRMARDLSEGKTFQWFTNGMMRATYERQESRHVVEFHDMRYSPASDGVMSLWSLRMVFNEAGKLLHLEWVEHHRRRGFKTYLANLWSDLWNP